LELKEGVEEVFLYFRHYDLDFGIDQSQCNPDAFRTFMTMELVEGELPIYFYLFRIEDRYDFWDDDCDDGLFLIAGQDLTPVPEPRAIALLAVAGLGALLFVRRRARKS